MFDILREDRFVEFGEDVVICQNGGEYMKIKEVKAIYTGGNIWLFYGSLCDGSFFLTDDYGCTLILDASPEDLDESLYVEWQEEHTIKELEDAERIGFCKKMLEKLKKESPENQGGFTEYDYYKNYFKEPF